MTDDEKKQAEIVARKCGDSFIQGALWAIRLQQAGKDLNGLKKVLKQQLVKRNEQDAKHIVDEAIGRFLA